MSWSIFLCRSAKQLIDLRMVPSRCDDKFHVGSQPGCTRSRVPVIVGSTFTEVLSTYEGLAVNSKFRSCLPPYSCSPGVGSSPASLVGEYQRLSTTPRANSARATGADTPPAAWTPIMVPAPVYTPLQ